MGDQARDGSDEHLYRNLKQAPASTRAPVAQDLSGGPERAVGATSTGSNGHAHGPNSKCPKCAAEREALRGKTTNVSVTGYHFLWLTAEDITSNDTKDDQGNPIKYHSFGVATTPSLGVSYADCKVLPFKGQDENDVMTGLGVAGAATLAGGYANVGASTSGVVACAGGALVAPGIEAQLTYGAEGPLFDNPGGDKALAQRSADRDRQRIKEEGDYRRAQAAMDAQAIADMAPRPRAPAPPYDPNWRVKAEGDARRAQAEMDRKALEAMMPPKK